MSSPRDGLARTLIVFSRDPGPTHNLLALLDALRRPVSEEAAAVTLFRDELAVSLEGARVFARGSADAIWRQNGYAPIAWAGRDDVAAGKLIDDAGAGFVLTGTSDIDEPADRALWRAARKKGIPSHAVLDQNINLPGRFTDADGCRTFPDVVYVRDEAFAVDLAAAGIEPTRIRVTGDLRLALMRRRLSAVSTADRAVLRASWGAKPHNRVILFVSECGREMAAAGRPAAYDEVEVLRRLLAALDAGRHSAAEGAEAGAMIVVVRPHPRDTFGKYSDDVGLRASGLRTVVSDAGAPEMALGAADIVVGINSTILHDAKLLGRPVLSLTGHPLGDEAGATR